MGLDDQIEIASAEQEHAINELARLHVPQSGSIRAHSFPQ